MSISDELKSLLFPCECVSGARSGYGDLWADITKKKLLPTAQRQAR